ncbi:Fat-like cadherin-related tumor suppressor [Orchesella cincta]|uniref:Fat-like cadherin-related tumor suppressor n=1 Tax=Orchesella cincta TaxID=48709 RepID=A0A1D2MRT2_ORCCI|nr:Fat-like cadherin-related tumor suppressor [Orchesella cincta]
MHMSLKFIVFFANFFSFHFLSYLGTLDIHGDPSRDISLSLRETTAPVRIEPGTKNITLTRKLDKEGIEGPSSVTFTVLCDKRNHNEPLLPVPVTIRVTDVNDNAPKFISGPFNINVSEQTLPGSTILSGIKATDLDQQGPYSTLTFSAINSVMGNPLFQHVSYSAILPSVPLAGTVLDIEPEPIYAFDQDTGINAPIIYSIPEGRAESHYFHMDAASGRITVARDVPEDQLTQPITLVLKKGNRNAPLHFVQPEFVVNVPENSPSGTILFTSLTSRPADKKLRFGIEGDTQGLFKVGSMGQLILKKQLDYETTQRHILRLWVTDGFQNASTTGRINVINVNDWAPRFRKSMYEFNVSTEKMSKEAPLGQIEVADGDIGDKLTLEIKNNDQIFVDDNGQLFLRNKTIVKREMMFLVVAKDSGDPPREAFVPVLVRLTDMPNSEDLLHADFDIKLALIAALALVLLALAIGSVLYFGYCRKRRKIQSESFQKRVLERNISNPLAIHKLSQPSSLRRSNKVRHMMNITSPILSSSYSTDAESRGLTPVDCTSQTIPVSVMNSAPPVKQKNVTWSPKVVQKMTPTPPVRSDATRITSMNGMNGNCNKGLELDPDTSVTPLETYRNQVSTNQNGRVNHIPNGADTMQSNTSLTLYF